MNQPTKRTSPDRTSKTSPDRTLPVGFNMVLTALVATTVTIAALAFAFSFGNVWTLDLTLGIERHIAPLVGPAVDLSVIGLLVTVQWLALAGVDHAKLRPARRLLYACGVVTLALNSTLSLLAGIHNRNGYALGRAAVEGIAPWLLIAWSHVGPLMLRLFVEIKTGRVTPVEDQSAAPGPVTVVVPVPVAAETTPVDQPTATVPDQTPAKPRTNGVRPRQTGPILKALPGGRTSLEDRVAELDRRYPDRIPSYGEAQKDLGWTSRGATGEAIKELRARREQTGPAAESDPAPLDREPVGASA